MKIITRLSIFLFLLSFTSIGLSDGYTNTEVYKLTAKNGTAVFTDKKPKKEKYEVQTIESSNPTGSGNYYKYETSPKKESKGKRRTTDKEKKTSLATCKRYKSKWKQYSAKMRVGYDASQYERLEKNRVKYRDLLFNQCNSHELI